MTNSIKNKLYLNFSNYSICLRFPDMESATNAKKHIFLGESFEGELAGSIDYIKDDSVTDLVTVKCEPNVVKIIHKDYDDDNHKIILKMFNKHTIALDVRNERVTVRYPSDAPLRLMLDDVLQAALQPILERKGGFILHGSCMVYKNRAIAFMGGSGSGKSTTAFNLLRFGFNCYADDAILVVPEGKKLCVSPLAREFSIRPLSFSLLKEYGVPISDYKKDGEKYYFSQKAEEFQSAILQHICFVEVGGESETSITLLSSDQALEILLKDTRHFSFMGRSSSEIFSKILAERVPSPLTALVGTNLDFQGKLFRNIVIHHKTKLPKENLNKKSIPGRKQKIDLIAKAWSSTGSESLKELIPLIGDFDIKIFTLSLSFFQTYPLSNIYPLKSDIVINKIPYTFEASFIKASDWIKGCRKLLQKTGIEVLERYALSWIKSAPIIYPFLKTVSSLEPEKSLLIEDAWKTFTTEKANIFCNIENNHIAIHLPVRRSLPNWSEQVFSSRRSWVSVTKNRIIHLYFWISVDQQLDEKDMEILLKDTKNFQRLTIVPVFSKKTNSISAVVRFFQYALRQNRNSEISRLIPLCKIDKENADFLLSKEAFEKWFEKEERTKSLYCFMQHEEIVKNGSKYPADWPDHSIVWREKPFDNCKTCGLHPLGLCLGGFFNI
jgi:hypothetical protein